MPYKDKTKRNEYSRTCMKRLRDSRKQNNNIIENNELPNVTENALVIPIVEIKQIIPSKTQDRFTTHHQQYIDKLKRIEESNNNRLREMNGSLWWQITVSDGVTYVPPTKYMSSSYL